MNLYLAEKHDVAKHIKNAFNIYRPNLSFITKNGYYISTDGSECITYAHGHLFTLIDPEDFNSDYKNWHLDHLPMEWPVKEKPIQKHIGHINTIKKLMKESKTIFNCCDGDSAGEHIFRDILYYSKLNKNHTVKRVLINDNNADKIIRAIESARPLSEFDGLYLEDLARSASDMRLGYGMTRLITAQSRKQGYNETFIVGRVLSCILGLVCTREQRKKSHIPEYYHTISGDFQTNAGTINGKLQVTDSLGLDLDEKGRILNGNQAQSLTERLNVANFVVSDIKRTNRNDSPPLPHDLLSLQVECRRLLNLSPDRVMEITQELRTVYFICSYNRTDNRYYPDEEHSDAPNKLAELAKIPDFAFVAEHCDPSIKSRGFNSSKITAHHALAPTENLSMYDKLPTSHKHVFQLIARQYIIQFLSKRERVETQIDFLGADPESGIEYVFKAKTSKVLNPGWAALFQNDRDSVELNAEHDSSDDTDINTNSIHIGNHCESKIESSQQETKAARSYNMTTLLQDLKHTAKYLPDSWYKQSFVAKTTGLGDVSNGETGGVGTPASRSDILKKAFTQELLMELPTKKKGGLGDIVPTDKGWSLFSILPQEITSPETTAVWSHYLAQISRQEIKPEDFWEIVNSDIAKITERVKSNGLKLDEFAGSLNKMEATQTAVSLDQAANDDCPKCHQPIQRKKGKFGFFWPCQSCGENFQDYQGKPFSRSCPECGEDLRVLSPKGSKKVWIGCKGYPACKFTDK